MKRWWMMSFCGVLVLPAVALAQFEACPGGVQVGQQCAGGVCQPVCKYYESATQAPKAPDAPRTLVRRGVWEDRWGAVANDRNGKIGVATNFPTRADAEAAATNDCIDRGGDAEGCKNIQSSYANQCIALAWGERLGEAGFAESAKAAEIEALAGCKRLDGGTCEIFYSDCSEAALLGYE